MKKYQAAVDKGLSYKYAVQGVLYDDLNQARSMQFMRYAIVWLLRLVSENHTYPKELLQWAIRQVIVTCSWLTFAIKVTTQFRGV